MVQRQASLESPHSESSVIPSYAWVILFVVFLMSVAAPLNMAKVPPLMPVLREAFALSLSQAGSLMSVFAITGLILALPTGFIMQRLGPKTTGIVAMACLVAGASLGALSTTAGLLLTSRVIEGLGMGLITVVAPAIIAMWFPREKRGVPMGIWATWVPVGYVLMYNLSPAITTSFGWQAVWWSAAGFALVALVLFALLMRMPTESEQLPRMDRAAGEPVKFGKALANRNIWLLALTFACFNLVFQGIGTFFPTFLSEVRGYPLGQASFIASISTMVVLASAPLAGWISDLIGSRKWMIIVPTTIIAVMVTWQFKVEGAALYAFMAAMGLIVGAVPTATFSAVPEVMDRPELAGIGMAVLSVGQNFGMVVGPIVFGQMVEAVGWLTAAYWLIPFCGVALVAIALTKVR